MTTAPAAAPPKASTTPPPPCTLADVADACKAACDAGHVLSCRNLGLLIQQGKAGRQNKGRLVELFRKACDADDAEACDELGSLLPEDSVSAALYRKACDTGYMPACGHLAGLLLVNGDMGVLAEKEADIKAAMALAQKGCESGHANSCTILGGVFRKGKPVKKDHRLAKQYLERACDMGDHRGCVVASIMYERGWDGEQADTIRSRKLEQRAFALVQSACTEKLQHCEYLVDYYATGIGTSEDLAKEREVKRDGCDRGAPHLCVLWGIHLEQGRGVSQDFASAGQFYRTACDDGEGSGCYRLAYLHAAGHGFPKDESKIASLLSESCDLGFMASCIWLATKQRAGDGVPKDLKSSVDLRRRACSHRGKEGCGQLALLLLGADEHGIPRKEAEAEAIRALTFGCEQVESGYECYQLAWMHDLGVGFPKNRTRARALAQQACDLGETAACQWLKDPAKGPSPTWVNLAKQPKK
ncbi:tetratricopeptide repeat protein [Polyangium sp. 15x6]|uniref:tetratricopeptide repeat protein n=1 Tax=Polyangium sp. 15x6 TaxID=3042687 RepID=UPI00249ABE72|nr:tetratricopeptide repeat protein [Polyangium sp. 15x6]MDI3283538.1 tetratricopeptide repeat protein [Polyangium sp. 15x6]